MARTTINARTTAAATTRKTAAKPVMKAAAKAPAKTPAKPAVDMARVQAYVEHITGRKSFKLVRCRAADSKYMVRAEPTVSMATASVAKMVEMLTEQLKRKPRYEDAAYGCAYVFNLGRKRQVRLSVNVEGRTQRVRGVTVREFN